MQTASLEIAGTECWARHVLFGVFNALLFVAMAGPIHGLVSFALDFSNSAASHIVVVPFISAGLIWLNRTRIFCKVGASILFGTAVVVVGSGLLLVSRIARARLTENDQLALATISIIMLWLGGFALIYGYATFRRALFPLLFLLFAVPLPTIVLNNIIEILRSGSSEMAFALLKMSGTPIYRQGFVFALPNLVVEVAPACSGIRSSIAILLASLVAGQLFLRSAWRKCALLVVSLLILVFKNAVRIAVLCLLTVHVNPGILASRLHHEGGISIFVLGLVMIYPFLFVLVKSESASNKRNAAV